MAVLVPLFIVSKNHSYKFLGAVISFASTFLPWIKSATMIHPAHCRFFCILDKIFGSGGGICLVKHDNTASMFLEPSLAHTMCIV